MLSRKDYLASLDAPPNTKANLLGNLLRQADVSYTILPSTDVAANFRATVYSWGAVASRRLIVGKGVYHDSGGMNLKSWDSDIHLMKHDCAGGLLSLLAPPGYLVAVPWMRNIFNTELPSGSVLPMANGSTVEILDTDAEGRIVCADAFAQLTQERKAPSLVVFITTCGMVLCPGYISYATDDEGLARKVAASVSKEKVLRVPVLPFQEVGLKSRVASIANTTGDTKLVGYDFLFGATSFLRYFTPGETKFLHIDVSGVVFDNYDAKKPCGYDFVKNLLETLG